MNKVLTGFSALLALSLASHAGIARELKAGLVTNMDSEYGWGATAFAERLSELTDGQLTVTMFPDGQLGKSDQAQLENVIAGSQDFFITGMEFYSSWDKRFGALATPFLFRDRAHFAAFLGSPIFADMRQTLINNGIRIACTEPNWLTQLDRGILSQDPVTTPDDIAGMKLRMFQSEVPVRSWQGLGANLVIMPFAEVYTALATGTVVGLTGNATLLFQGSLYEHINHFAVTEEYYQVLNPAMSEKTWQSLTPQQQDAVVQACQEVGPLFVEHSSALRDEIYGRARDAGVTVEEIPLGPWREKMAPILVEFDAEGVIPTGMLEQIQAIE
jgi:TRAP-type C4-dicarboxylate transport system substrate-binding protein